MNENERRLWWQAYLAALTGMHAYGDAGESYTIDGASKAAVSAANRALDDYHDHLGTDSPASEPAWTGHARVELMGHRSYLGRIREVERFGAKMGEVQELLPTGEYGEVHQFGGKAIHTLTAVTLDEALRELRPIRYRTCSSKGCWTNVELVWGHPQYDDPSAVYCEKCKAKGKDEARPCDGCDHECHHSKTRAHGCDDEECMKDPAHPHWMPELPW